MSEDALLQEYYEVFRTVNEFDKRLLTVKGWGVTLALAALAWGFKERHFGLFLVASLSGLAFWLIEGVMKQHQMRYYIRMREIEVHRYEKITSIRLKGAFSPRIDSSWWHAGSVYAGKSTSEYHPQMPKGSKASYYFAWLFPHVAFPHMFSVFAGIVFFIFSVLGKIGINCW